MFEVKLNLFYIFHFQRQKQLIIKKKCHANLCFQDYISTLIFFFFLTKCLIFYHVSLRYKLCLPAQVTIYFKINVLKYKMRGKSNRFKLTKQKNKLRKQSIPTITTFIVARNHFNKLCHSPITHTRLNLHNYADHSNERPCTNPFPKTCSHT